MYIMQDPFFITSRLNVGLQMEGGYLEHRSGTFVFVLEDGQEYPVEDYSPGCGHSLFDCFEDIIVFLDAWAQDPHDNECFPEPLREWAKGQVFDLDEECLIEKEK